MRYKDKKIHENQSNISKINKVLNACNCYFVKINQDNEGFNKYVLFKDKVYNKCFLIEVKKVGYDNVMAILDKGFNHEV